MRPQLWEPPIELSPAEAALVRRIQRANLFVFLRQQRHVLSSAAFQQELAELLYAEAAVGHPPLAPAQPALATLLQAYTGVSDNEVIAATTMDRRWQLVLNCLDCARPPFQHSNPDFLPLAADGPRRRPPAARAQCRGGADPWRVQSAGAARGAG